LPMRVGAEFSAPARLADCLVAHLASAAIGAGTLGARAAADRMTASAVDRLGNVIRSGGAPITIAPMGPRAASPLAALLMGSGVNAQPYAPGLGAAFAQ
jgi:hypothetical protein